MNAKTFVTIMATLLYVSEGRSQNQETTDSIARELQEVVVTARQPATKLVGSTLVSTIAGSNLAELGNALDVLAQLPMIIVQDNCVSVVGKSDIEIFIDGRPLRDEAELQQILSNNLKKVELNMAPGAAYNSTTGAVLKITTKRSFVKGLSLTDRFQLQRRRKWSAMDYLALSYSHGDWELSVDGTVNHNNSLAKGSTTNTLVYDGHETLIGSSQQNTYPVTTGVVKAGFNYAKGARSLGAYYRYNPEHGDFENLGTEWLDNNPLISRKIDKQTRAYSHLASMYYENTPGGKYQIHFDGDFKNSSSRSNTATIYQASDAPDIKSEDERNSTLLAGKLYVKFPLWNGDLTMGTQDSYTRTSLDYHMHNIHVGAYIPSVRTDARQISAAMYVSWSRIIGKLSLTAGARYEYVDYDFKTNGRRDENMSRRDHLLTPDISLGYSFSRDAQISLNYKMTTVKPPYSQLTGSLSYVGIHEIEGGNAALRDEKAHDIQLFGSWKGFMLQAGFTRALDTYAYVKQLYPANSLQLLMHPININVSALSLFLVWSKPSGLWTPDFTAGMYRQWLNLAGRNYDKPIFSYYLDNTFSLAGGWTITANINGRTQGDMHTNRFCTTWFAMDVSVGKVFLNRSLTVKLAATDIFNTVNNDWTMNTFGVFVDKRQSYDRRGVSLSVIYNFQPHKSKYKGATASEAEMKRL